MIRGLLHVGTDLYIAQEAYRKDIAKHTLRQPKKPKPHIIRSHDKYHHWYCVSGYGFGVVGAGDTPAEAYYNWTTVFRKPS